MIIEFQKVHNLKLPVDIKRDIRQANMQPTDASCELRSYLEELRNEREGFLLINGAINPFVRKSPFPPFHINLNYFVNPRTLYESKEIKGLYDEHFDGLAVSRADPLQFKGVATTPFDPTLKPSSSDQIEPWWTTLQDFFVNK